MARGRPRVLRNAAANGTGYALNLFLVFFLSPYVVNELGKTAYGIWVLLWSVVGYLGLLDFGVRGAITRYVAKFHEEAEHDRSSRTASTAVGIFAIAGGIAVTVGFILSAFAERLFQIPPEFRVETHVIFLIGGFSAAISLIGGVFSGILAGLQRFGLLNTLDIAVAILRASAIVVSLHSGFGLIALAVIELTAALARGGFSAWLSCRAYPELRLRLSCYDRSYFRLIFSFSLYLFAIHLSYQFIMYSDALVIATFLPVSFVAFFAIATNVVAYSKDLIGCLTRTMTPLASSLDSRGDIAELRRVTQQYAAFASMLMLPIALTLAIRGSTFIGLWMGPEFGDRSGVVLRILIGVSALSAANGVVCSVLLGMGKQKSIAPVFVAEALCNLVLSCLLVRPYGIAGVALGTLIPALLTQCIFWPWYLSLCLGVPMVRYYMATWVRPLLGSIPFALLSYAFEMQWLPANVFTFFIQVGTCLPLAALGFWVVCSHALQGVLYTEGLGSAVVREIAASKINGEIR